MTVNSSTTVALRIPLQAGATSKRKPCTVAEAFCKTMVPARSSFMFRTHSQNVVERTVLRIRNPWVSVSRKTEIGTQKKNSK